MSKSNEDLVLPCIQQATKIILNSDRYTECKQFTETPEFDALGGVARDSKSLRTELNQPQITSYGFIRLLLAKLRLLGRGLLSKDTLVRGTYALNEKSQYRHLLSDIGYRVAIDSLVSPEIDDSFAMLKSFGMISEPETLRGKIIILFDEEMASNMLHGYTQDVCKIMDAFIVDLLALDLI